MQDSIGRAWQPGRVAVHMTHGMNDDFVFRGLIKNEIGIRRRRQAADRIIRAGADVGRSKRRSMIP